MEEPFKIFKVNNELALKFAKANNKPHRHNHETIFISIKGTSEHFIDFHSTILQSPFVSFVSKGKAHRLQPLNNTESEGYAIQFQSEFVSETIFQLYHLFHDNAHISFSNDREFERIITLCKMLEDESQQKQLDYSIIRSLFSTLLTILEAKKRISVQNTSIDKQHKPFIDFLKILEENFHRPVSVSFYAEKLFMSSRNLNLICHQVLQKSISEIIQTRKLIEAKNLLITTSKSINEIGFELGYKEKAYFSSIFKKKTGQTPSEFRKETQQLFS